MQTKEIKEMIYFIAKGLTDWKKNDWKSVPESLYKGHLLFIKQAVQSTLPPNNLYDFITLLHKPMKMWGIDMLEELFPEDATFLVEGFDISIDIEDFLEEYEFPEEFDQSVMKEILQYCRQRNLDDSYRTVRSIIATPDYAVIASGKLYFKTLQIKDKELQELFKKCYEPLPQPIINYKKCPHCGWTLSFVKGRWVCNKEHICGHFQSFEHLESYEFLENELIYRIRPGIQRYVLLTGMIEESLYQRLKQYDAILYPNVDEFDIRIHANGKIIDLDVKDYRSPRQLAHFFNDKSVNERKKYHENSFIVIPNYRLQMNVNYKELLCASLNEEVRKSIRFITERELLNRLREGTLCYKN